ncbi:hypothetical protein [uncultured Sphingorhabdus sp.]|uniref:hypothetical protein n=1 Tax=uncultured Sphingorhabdus sp. TaxID=1686106 RepID=UPI0026078870|nr:hypothetical protein [uncultured Sphingorhabdus sp.]
MSINRKTHNTNYGIDNSGDRRSLNFCEDFYRLQRASRIRRPIFRISLVPGDRVDLLADLVAANIGTCLIGRYLVFQSQSDTGAIGRKAEIQGALTIH